MTDPPLAAAPSNGFKVIAPGHMKSAGWVNLASALTAYQRDQSPDDRLAYAAAEKDAAASRLGLWQDAEPVPPWDWRQPNKLNT